MRLRGGEYLAEVRQFQQQTVVQGQVRGGRVEREIEDFHAFNVRRSRFNVLANISEATCSIDFER